MRQRTAVILISASVATIAALVMFRASYHSLMNLRQKVVSQPMNSLNTAETISSAAELNNIVSHERVILHFDVDWAHQAILSRPVIIKFKETIERDLQYQDVEFRRVDCTKQEGPVWDAVEKWLRLQNADDSLMFTGYGAIAWVKSGKVVHAVHDAADEGVENLVERTHLAIAVEPLSH